MTMPKLLVVGFVIIIVWSSVFGQEQAPAPSFKDGDTWQFNISWKGQIATSTERHIGIYEVVVSRAAVKLYQVDGDQKNEIAIKPDGPTQALLGLVGKSNQRPDLKFPLLSGKKWTYQFVTRPPAAKFYQRRSAEVTIGMMEEVRTPAGSFKAYKLIRSERWTIGNKYGKGHSSTTTYFYSPETRSVVKSSSIIEDSGEIVEYELTKFTPGN